jgi:hypothetical protein
MRLRILLIYFALVAALGVVVGTGLITGPGAWYSSSMPYRYQTEAFLRGEIALSKEPTGLQHDHVWAEGGVQQVWGLGVPVWRLPFEAAAKLVGQPMFPDRIAMALALALFAYVVLASVTNRAGAGSVMEWIDGMRRYPEHLLVAVLLILFPPLIVLLRGPFNVYEEAVAYGCLVAIGMLAALLALARRPVTGHYLLLCLAAGLIGFVRPTMLAYGMATVLLAFCIAWRSGWNWRLQWSGWAAFVAGVGLLLATNAMRYGSAFEFGHRLNVTGLDLIYASRFEALYHSESFVAAAKELFGSVFLTREMNGFAVYQEGVVPMQAPSPRWRHFYQPTFGPTYLVLVAAGWFLGFRKLVTEFVRRRDLRLDATTVAAAWSFGAMIPIAYFLLHFHASSSRYILDFAPGIAAGIAAGLYALKDLPERWKGRRTMGAIAAVFVLWWGWQVLQADYDSPGRAPLNRVQAEAFFRDNVPPFGGLPSEYALGDGSLARTGIHGNGLGWHADDGRVRPTAVVFVEDMEWLKVDLAPTAEEPLPREQYTQVRAKIGLEELALESMEETETGWRLKFAAPERKAYREGVQVVFLALVPVEDFLESYSPFVLSRVAWREE